MALNMLQFVCCAILLVYFVREKTRLKLIAYIYVQMIEEHSFYNIQIVWFRCESVS